MPKHLLCAALRRTRLSNCKMCSTVSTCIFALSSPFNARNNSRNFFSFRQSSLVWSSACDPTDATKRKAIYDGISVVVKRLTVQLPKSTENDMAQINALRAMARRLKFYGLSKPVNLTRFSDNDLQEFCLVTTF